MDAKLREYVSTWDLSVWRRYLEEAYRGAEIGRQPLANSQRKALRRHIFEQFRSGVPGSANVTGMVWSMLEAHKEHWSHPDTKALICPCCSCTSGLREIPGHERVKCPVCGKFSTRWQWQEDKSPPPEYEDS